MPNYFRNPFRSRAPRHIEFEEVMEDEALYNAFYAHCVSEFNQESLDFMNAMSGPYLSRLTMIIETFIKVKDDNSSINISSNTQKTILAEYAKLSNAGLTGGFKAEAMKEALDSAVAEVTQLLKSDVYYRFRGTDAYIAARAQRGRRKRWFF